MNWDDMWDPGKFFHGKQNPADSAMPYLNQIPGALQNAYGPYMQNGQQNYNQLQGEYGAMAGDPSAYLQKMMQNYKPSAGYQFKQDQMQRAAGNTAAAGGMRGSMTDIQNQGHLSDMLAGDDMQQWLSNVMGIQNQGMGGQQHMYDIGYDASKSYGGDLSNLYGTQAQLGFKGREDQNQGIFSNSGGAGGLLGGLAAFL